SPRRVRRVRCRRGRDPAPRHTAPAAPQGRCGSGLAWSGGPSLVPLGPRATQPPVAERRGGAGGSVRWGRRCHRDFPHERRRLDLDGTTQESALETVAHDGLGATPGDRALALRRAGLRWRGAASRRAVGALKAGGLRGDRSVAPDGGGSRSRSGAARRAGAGRDRRARRAPREPAGPRGGPTLKPVDLHSGAAGADVCLVLEGSYPYVKGGVSTWVHDLIGSLPELRFALVHVGP